MKPWYGDGLRFECTRCAHCCTGPQGYVWLSPHDQESIAGHLGLDLAAFRKRYTRLVGRLLSLVDKPNGDCIFLDEHRHCTIQAVKPRQCLTFPFWPRIAASRESWEEMGESCPGMGQGPLFAPGEITTLLDRESPREILWKVANRQG
jgi:uncharacterized protein